VSGGLSELSDSLAASDFARTGHALVKCGLLDKSASEARICRRAAVSDAFRQDALRGWVTFGDGFRNDFKNDLALLDIMRSILPAYAGPALMLYRGDSFFNRRRRTYGWSWSANPDTARDFAMGPYREFEGGSVLLEADVSADAIICAPATLGDDYGEEEFIVDRRKLKSVRVLERLNGNGGG
jgi:hypothetical protein